MSKSFVPSTTSERRAYAKSLIGVKMSNYEIQTQVKNRYGIKISSRDLNLLRAGLLPLKATVEVRKIGTKRPRASKASVTPSAATNVATTRTEENHQNTSPVASNNRYSDVLLAAKLVGAKSVTVGDVTVNL